MAGNRNRNWKQDLTEVFKIYTKLDLNREYTESRQKANSKHTESKDLARRDCTVQTRNRNTETLSLCSGGRRPESLVTP